MSNLNNGFQVISTSCHTAKCCPSVIAAPDGENLVIVGMTNMAMAADDVVRGKTEHNEAAVVIPRSVLLDAARALNNQG